MALFNELAKMIEDTQLLVKEDYKIYYYKDPEKFQTSKLVITNGNETYVCNERQDIQSFLNFVIDKVFAMDHSIDLLTEMYSNDSVTEIFNKNSS